MKLLDQLLKINLFQKFINSKKLSASEFATLTQVLVDFNVAFVLAFSPPSADEFATVELTITFSPTFSLTFSLLLCP